MIGPQHLEGYYDPTIYPGCSSHEHHEHTTKKVVEFAHVCYMIGGGKLGHTSLRRIS